MVSKKKSMLWASHKLTRKVLSVSVCVLLTWHKDLLCLFTQHPGCRVGSATDTLYNMHPGSAAKLDHYHRMAAPDNQQQMRHFHKTLSGNRWLLFLLSGLVCTERRLHKSKNKNKTNMKISHLNSRLNYATEQF